MNNKFCLAFLISVFLFGFSLAQTTVTVEEVVQMALQKNYDIQVARTTAATQLTDKRFIYGAFIPSITGSGSYLFNNVNVRNTPWTGSEIIKNNVGSVSENPNVQLVWTLFDGTKMFATRQRLLQLAELGEVNIRNQMMNTTAATMTNFYNIVRQQEQLKAIQEVMAVNLERVKLAERKLEVGTGAKPELLQAKVDLNAQRTLAVQQEILIQQIKDQMNGQTGFGLPENFLIADTIPINLNLTSEEIISEIEKTNQAVLTAKKNLEIATTAIWENRASRSPVIQFVGAYNYNYTLNKLQTSPFALKESKTNGYNYGISLSVPIINNMNASRLIAQAKVTQSRMQAIYDQQKTIAVVGVRNAFTNYENSKKILQIQEENILVAKENVAIALAGFRRGITTFIELRTAQQSLSDAYNQLIAARFSTKASEIELMRLQGSLLKSN
jgi:outer membrane protein TolC